MMIDSVIRHVEANAQRRHRGAGQAAVAYERLGQLHDRLEVAKEDERRFLAHELHDELGQTLTALKLRLQLGARAGGGAGRRRRRTAVALVDNLIARVRKMSVDLRPPLLDEVGLVPALRAYLETQSAVSGVAMELEEGDGEDAAAPGRAAAVRSGDRRASASCRSRSPTRSAMRPPGASACLIVRRAAGVRLSVKDDGRGFDVAGTLEIAAAEGTWASLACANGCARRRHVPGQFASRHRDDGDGRSPVQAEQEPGSGAAMRETRWLSRFR